MRSRPGWWTVSDSLGPSEMEALLADLDKCIPLTEGGLLPRCAAALRQLIAERVQLIAERGAWKRRYEQLAERNDYHGRQLADAQGQIARLEAALRSIRNSAEGVLPTAPQEPTP
jgi:hypothetical protein